MAANYIPCYIDTDVLYLQAQKLGPDDCAKEDLVRMLFEEDWTKFHIFSACCIMLSTTAAFMMNFDAELITASFSYSAP